LVPGNKTKKGGERGRGNMNIQDKETATRKRLTEEFFRRGCSGCEGRGDGWKGMFRRNLYWETEPTLKC
jgi:hypothetical protein